MQIYELCRDASGAWRGSPGEPPAAPQLVLYFGARGALVDGYGELRRRFAQSHIVGCSTAGEILDKEVFDDSVVAVAVQFAEARVAVASLAVADEPDGRHAGRALARRLAGPALRGMLVLSDGIGVNGSDLVRGLRDVAGDSVPIGGGLAGDGERFECTLVGCDGPPTRGTVAAVAFYGASIELCRGSFGGWSTFGPERVITRSVGNVLFEVDDQPVLALYKRYLGDEAAHLPGSALLFPLRVRDPLGGEQGVMRTVLGVDEAAQSMTFAGDVPQGHIAELMHASFESLVNGAGDAADEAAAAMMGGVPQRLALLVSCVGRKMVLGARAADEVEEVKDRLGPSTRQIGFYAYGEIGKYDRSACELLNQTMTINVLSERATTSAFAASVGEEDTFGSAPLHSTLKRQLRRAKRGGDTDLLALLASVNDTYEQMDRERRRQTRAIRTASAELSDKTAALVREVQRADSLLLSILPAEIAERLKKRPDELVADAYEHVTILFTDFVGFTGIAANVSAERLVGDLNEIFGHFDALCVAHRMEKIKTIGDAYLAVGGLPLRNDSHVTDALAMAVAMRDYIDGRLARPDCLPFRIRIGIHTAGPVIAGVIGKSKFAYDLWGSSVNIAARMESSSEPGRINVSQATRDAAGDAYRFVDRGEIEVKGGGPLRMYFVERS